MEYIIEVCFFPGFSRVSHPPNNHSIWNIIIKRFQSRGILVVNMNQHEVLLRLANSHTAENYFSKIISTHRRLLAQRKFPEHVPPWERFTRCLYWVHRNPLRYSQERSCKNIFSKLNQIISLFFSLHRFMQELTFERVPFTFYMDVFMVERGEGSRHTSFRISRFLNRETL